MKHAAIWITLKKCSLLWFNISSLLSFPLSMYAKTFCSNHSLRPFHQPLCSEYCCITVISQTWSHPVLSRRIQGQDEQKYKQPVAPVFRTGSAPQIRCYSLHMICSSVRYPQILRTCLALSRIIRTVHRYSRAWKTSPHHQYSSRCSVHIPLRWRCSPQLRTDT